MFEGNREMQKLLIGNGHRHVLIAGIDVSKNKFTIAAVNGEYEDKIKAKDVKLTKTGLNELYKEIDTIVKNEKIKQIIFGCEPSGIYYKPIMRDLIRRYPTAIFKLINPLATKSNRDQKMERGKTDPIDTYAITDLLIRGECYEFDDGEDSFDIIKEYVKELDHIVKDVVRIKNKLHAYTDEIYPGLESENTSFLESEYGRIFLRILPDPKQLPTLSKMDWKVMLRTKEYELPDYIADRLAGRCKELIVSSHKQYKTLKGYIIYLVDCYEQLESRKNRIEENLENLIIELPFGENLLEIKGLGILTIARLIAYMGNPYKFMSGKQVASFAGLVPKANQSGKQDKERKLSKKGNRKLRAELVMVAQRMISSVGYFTAYYNRLVIENRKDPMVAIVATANKLIRVIMHMIHTGEKFNPPTAKNKEAATGKINRLTKKKLIEFNKNKKLDSLTQDIKDLYHVRV